MEKYLYIKDLKFLVGLFADVESKIVEQIAKKGSLVVLPCSLNDIASASTSPGLMSSYRNIDICVTDGVPLVWWSAHRTKYKTERIYGPELAMSVMRDTQGKQLRHVLCGSSPIRLQKFMNRVLSIAPKINIVGMFSPTILIQKTKEEEECLQKIIKCGPSILWIGMSSPKQVVLAARWKRQFPHATIMCVGAALDLISGEVPTAPLWMQAMGLEWLFRLIAEPKRLYKRYLFTIPRFILGEITLKLWGPVRACFCF